jgi:thiamine biosynthesis protein ThiS
MGMHIILNSNPVEIATGPMTVNELLRDRNFTFRMLVIRINGELVKKTDYDTALVKDGDEVSVLHLISGG